MSQPLLLQIAHDSIKEVLQANNIIDKPALLQAHPLLEQKIFTTIKIYVDEELRGSSQSKNPPEHSLLYETIIHAKRAAFEQESSEPLTILEYLACEIEISLHTQDGVISHRG